MHARTLMLLLHYTKRFKNEGNKTKYEWHEHYVSERDVCGDGMRKHRRPIPIDLSRAGSGRRDQRTQDAGGMAGGSEERCVTEQQNEAN